jgi:hypothetical protein
VHQEDPLTFGKVKICHKNKGGGAEEKFNIYQ